MEKDLPNILNYKFESSDEEELVHNEEKDMEQKEPEQNEPLPNIPQFSNVEIEEDTIFDKPKKEVVKEVVEEVSEDEPEPLPVQKKKKDMEQTKPKKPRKPMTEEHKAKLALAREKALVAKRKNKLERESMKQKATKKKELLKKKEDLELEELEEEVNTKKEKKTKTIKESEPVVNKNYITREDLAKAQFATLHAYENMRKERKKKKKEEKAISDYHNKVQETINNVNNAVPEWAMVGTKWSDCF
jgi:hypothetical protein